MGYKVSIIVPIYNTEAYLPKCIDSILSQSFTDYELLLIDDGSIDNSGAICEKYAQQDNRIKVFHKKTEVFVQRETLVLTMRKENGFTLWILMTS